nr:hypothetical protein RKHAN_04093 [Rhizobium sp. Khangiran2]
MADENIKQKLAKLRRRPWRLIITSISENIAPLSAETIEALERIFELFPHLGSLTVQTNAGDVQVTRDYPGNYTAEVDRLLEVIFQNDPAISGIIFPATATQPEHRATPDDPHWSASGKEVSAINAALEAGQITGDQARQRLKELFSRG